MVAIPVVDLGNLGLHNAGKPDSRTIERIVAELDEAFSTVGFVYLKNHGIKQTTLDEVYEASKKFYTLPSEVKDLYKRDPTKSTDGYVGVNVEFLGEGNRYEIREAFNTTTLEPTKTDLYPDKHAPEFRNSIAKIVPQLCELTGRILRCLSLGLGQDEDFLTKRHGLMFQGPDKNMTTLRTLYYPPLKDDDVKPGVVRCGAHSDYGTITLLFQDDMGGLEVQSGDKWIAADPIPGTILVNLGDLMQFWTAGRYKATVHRVLIPEAEIRRRNSRQSIAFFVHPDNGVMVSQLNGHSNHPPVEALEYVMSRFASTYKQ